MTHDDGRATTHHESTLATTNYRAKLTEHWSHTQWPVDSLPGRMWPAGEVVFECYKVWRMSPTSFEYQTVAIFNSEDAKDAAYALFNRLATE